jgi:hypothetical protein
MSVRGPNVEYCPAGAVAWQAAFSGKMNQKAISSLF